MSAKVFKRDRWDWTPTRVVFWKREHDQFTLFAATSILVDAFRPRGYVAQLGWGFDSQEPLRPWPVFYRHLSCDPVDENQHALSCIHGVAMAGFYITVGTLDFA